MRRILLTLALWLLSTGVCTAMTTITALPQQSRNGGTYTSPAWLVPDGIAVTGQVCLVLNVLLTDLQDDRNVVDLKLEKSTNGTSNWQMVSGAPWQGGNYLDRFGNVLRGPMECVNIVEFIGQYLRLTITTSRRMTWGVDVDVY